MRANTIRGILFVVATSLCVASLSAQTAPRPHITGISHVGYFVSDLPKALRFWHDFLGYDESYVLTKPGTNQVSISFIKINDHQHIELFTAPPASPPSMMSHLCFSVDDIAAMRTYLRANGVNVSPGPATKTRAGDYAFEIKDPDGTLIEFVQSLPTGLESKATGKFLPATRISTAIFHVGFIVGNTDKSLAFYRDILGFQETWRGSSNGTELSWINMQVPGDADYIELMLYNKVPGNYGSSNHTSLVVPDMQQAVDTLKSRAAAAGYTRPLDIHEGKNHKRQVNLYDPDGTRVELMEPNTVDGKPAPSSTAPPPPPAHN